MDSVITLNSRDNSESEEDWELYSNKSSESILSTSPSEKFWTQTIHPHISIRLAKTVYRTYRRCLIDNTVKDSALSHAYCLSRRLEPRWVNALEFAWGMQCGTLNLNTRLNVLCLSPRLKDFWENFKWFLLPEHHTIRCLHEAAMTDQESPELDEGPYNYRFIPHPDMKTVAIHRQIVFPEQEVAGPEPKSLKPEHFMFCSYPFETLGTLPCHLHPKFVICHIGWIAARADKVLIKYVDAHPDLLEPIIMCLQLCNKWSRLLDKANPKHLSFLQNKINRDDIIREDWSMTGNGRLKPPKHLKKDRTSTGVKRKRKGSPPHFVPTKTLRMLEDAAKRKSGSILSWRSGILGGDDTQVPMHDSIETNTCQKIDTKTGMDMEMGLIS